MLHQHCQKSLTHERLNQISGAIYCSHSMPTLLVVRCLRREIQAPFGWIAWGLRSLFHIPAHIVYLVFALRSIKLAKTEEYLLFHLSQRFPLYAIFFCNISQVFVFFTSFSFSRKFCIHVYQN